MKTETQLYTNRYGDVYQFTQLEDGNILWEGPFEYCRVGMPNDYTKAYEAYKANGGTEPIEKFKDLVYDYDYETKTYKLDIPEVRNLVVPDRTKIDMVDPSGGPYIASGMEWMGSIVKELVSHGQGFKIIVESQK
jgi:hypothetical protein